MARINAMRDAEALRKEIVATKEGGAITGELRSREYSDDLYGAITSWEGAPSTYQVARIGVLSAERDGIAKRFDGLAVRASRGRTHLRYADGARPLKKRARIVSILARRSCLASVSRRRPA